MTEPDLERSGFDNTSAFALLESLERRQDDATERFSPAELEHVNQIANTWQGPTTAITHWRIVSDFLSTTQPDDVHLVQPAVRTISDGLTRREVFTQGTAWRATIPLLASLVYVAIRVDLPSTARDLLRTYRHRVNQLTAASRDSIGYITSRPQARLEPAAMLAFERIDRELAVLCAEAGRLKLLTAVSVGSRAVAEAGEQPDGIDSNREGSSVPSGAERREPRAFGNIGDVDRTSVQAPEAFQDVIWTLMPFELDQSDYNDKLRELAASGGHRAWLRDVLLPWQPVAIFTGGPRAEDLVQAPDVKYSAWLDEPTLDSIEASLGPGTILFYPFITATWIGVVFLTSDSMHSFKVTVDEVQELRAYLGEAGSLFSEDEVAGYAIARRLTEYIKGKVPFLVAWSPRYQSEIRALATGMSAAWHNLAASDVPSHEPGATSVEPDYRIIPPLTLPSVRLLGPESAISRPQHITFIGDAKPDESPLAGPWIEAACWGALADSFGYEPTILLGQQATREHLREALQSSDLLALGIHAFSSRYLGPTLELADGVVAYDDIISHTVRAPTQIILASCTAGASASDVPAEDALGLATALLAAGARRVLAPVEPVQDIGSALLMHMLIQELGHDNDLRRAWGIVGSRARAGALNSQATVREVLGQEPLVHSAFPYPPYTIERAMAARATTLHRTFKHYILFGA